MRLTTDDIAEACYEANRVIKRALEEDPGPAWFRTPKWKKDLVRKGVRFHVKRRGKATPKQSHANWILGMQADGWTHGVEFDAEAKTHPCLVPFDDLPAAQQLKDEMFGNVVRTLLPFHGDD